MKENRSERKGVFVFDRETFSPLSCYHKLNREQEREGKGVLFTTGLTERCVAEKSDLHTISH